MIKTTVKDSGFEGILFEGNGNKEKVIIVMSGSNGGMTITKQCAMFYHRNGIASLALALFGTKGTQPFLDRVPVEYVENAIKWLKMQGYQKIGIDGTSKGSEMALLAASMFAELSCVIARVPSHFVSEGLIGKMSSKRPSGTSCFSYKGKEIPYAPYNMRTFDLVKMFVREKEMHIIDYNKDKDVTSDSIIPIENIRGPVLLLSAENDTVWPSYESASCMERKFEEISFPYAHRHICYKHISHAMLSELPLVYRVAFKTERNNPKECQKDRENMKKELLNWVNNVWH